MATFDGWEAQLYGPNTLAHFRTRGSKNGVRRFQNEDGTWTPLGLKERKEREGWGESRAERRAEKKEARAARAEERREKRRQNNVKTMTNAELQKRIERLKLEKEYKQMTRSPVLEAGVKVVSFILERKDKKEQREIEKDRQMLEWDRLRTQKLQAKEASKKAKYESETAKAEAEKKKADVKGGLKTERKAQLTNAKTNYRNTTLFGALGKRANNRAKYIQENRMVPIEAKKAARTAKQLELANEREMWKAFQEKWKASGRKP